MTLLLVLASIVRNGCATPQAEKWAWGRVTLQGCSFW